MAASCPFCSSVARVFEHRAIPHFSDGLTRYPPRIFGIKIPLVGAFYLSSMRPKLTTKPWCLAEAGTHSCLINAFAGHGLQLRTVISMCRGCLSRIKPARAIQELPWVGNLHITEENVAGSCRDLSDIIFLYLNEALKLVYIVINIIIIVAMAVCPRCLESWTWNLFNGIVMVFCKYYRFPSVMYNK